MTAGTDEFGPYIVYERLGQGGMATVHRAEKRGVGIRRPIALKRLLPHVATNPELVKLFVDEARLASHLRHANVAQTYELGKVGDTFFIAMEYASGPTLAQIMRQCQRLGVEIPVTITVNVVAQVCEALDHAHNLCDESGRSLNIIHRDVSPTNVIVTNTGIVKLIDFGIAKASISSVKTQTGLIKGKFGYIAPEYVSGRIDARVDLFAVGVVLHELLAGRRLFDGKDDIETMANIRDMVILPPSRWNSHVPADLDDIVLTALQRDPARRWQGAAAMQVALANVARELGVVVGSQQLVEWVDWAFSQLPAGIVTAVESETSAGNTETRERDANDFSRGNSSFMLEHSSVEAATPPPQRYRAPYPSDIDETVPVERVKPALTDFEMLTPPSPPTPRPSRDADAPSPRASHRADDMPTATRSSRQLDAVAPPRASHRADDVPTATRSSRQLDAVAPPRASHRADDVPTATRSSRQLDAVASPTRTAHRANDVPTAARSSRQIEAVAPVTRPVIPREEPRPSRQVDAAPPGDASWTWELVDDDEPPPPVAQQADAAPSQDAQASWTSELADDDDAAQPAGHATWTSELVDDEPPPRVAHQTEPTPSPAANASWMSELAVDEPPPRVAQQTDAAPSQAAQASWTSELVDDEPPPRVAQQTDAAPSQAAQASWTSELADDEPPAQRVAQQTEPTPLQEAQASWTSEVADGGPVAQQAEPTPSWTSERAGGDEAEPAPRMAQPETAMPVVPMARQIEVIVVPPGSMFAEPAELEAAARRAARSTTSTTQEPRSVVWLILLMVALGVSAMAAAYFWPM